MNLFTKKVLLAFIIAGAIAPFELFSVKRKLIEITDTESSEESEKESEEETKQKQKKNKYCTICEKEFSRPEALKNHITAKHSISKSLQCPLHNSNESLKSGYTLECLKSGYKNERSLRKHLKTIHLVTGEKAENYLQEALNAQNNSDNSNDTRISCPLHKEGTCRTDGYINKVKELADHFICIHKMDSKDARKLARETLQLICKTCGAEVASKKNFERHIKICTGIKKIVCDQKTPQDESFSNTVNIQEVSTEIRDPIEEPTLLFSENNNLLSNNCKRDETYINETTSDNENNTIENTKDDNDGNNDGDFDVSIFFNQKAFHN